MSRSKVAISWRSTIEDMSGERVLISLCKYLKARSSIQGKWKSESRYSR